MPLIPHTAPHRLPFNSATVILALTQKESARLPSSRLPQPRTSHS